MSTIHKKKLAILTSGGDAPGMNAAVRGVVRTCEKLGISCVGVRRGYNGLINGDIIEMNARSVDGIISRGGTVLYTARCKEFYTDEGIQKAADTCKYLGIDGLIAVGGDGTFTGALKLSKLGVPVIGIPGTIDNDIACTHYTIGFDTACNTAVDAIDKLRDTMQSHERCSVIEVMGRRAGHLALYVGIASGATATIVPERPFDFDTEIAERIRNSKLQGRNHYIIVVAEGVGMTNEIADRIQRDLGVDSRVTILGHIQRGGSPSARDRVTATRLGVYATQLFEQGIFNRVVAMTNGQLCEYDIEEALQMKKDLLESMYEAAQMVSV